MCTMTVLCTFVAPLNCQRKKRTYTDIYTNAKKNIFYIENTYMSYDTWRLSIVGHRSNRNGCVKMLDICYTLKS